MQVECIFFGPFREAVGAKRVDVETEASTVAELLDELERSYPDLAGELRDDDGLRSDVAVTVNERHLQYLDGPETGIDDGDVLRVTQSIHGG